MSNNNENLIDLYDHFQEKRMDSISRHIESGVRTDNVSWSKKKRKEYDDRRKAKKQEQAQ